MSEVFFPWIESGGFSENWLEGLGFAGIGFLGALVTVYLFLGDFLPSMGGKAEYESLRVDIQQFERRRDDLLRTREAYVREADLDPAQLAAAERLTADLSGAITAMESDARHERRRLLAMGLPIYLVLGGAFAVFFATNLLQALLIGFGWTAVADRFGLSREVAEKARRADQEAAKLTAEKDSERTSRRQLEQQVKELRNLRDQLVRAVSSSPKS